MTDRDDRRRALAMLIRTGSAWRLESEAAVDQVIAAAAELGQKAHAAGYDADLGYGVVLESRRAVNRDV